MSTIVDATNFNPGDVAYVLWELIQSKEKATVLDIITSISTQQRFDLEAPFLEFTQGRHILEAVNELFGEGDAGELVQTLFKGRLGNAARWLRDAIAKKDSDTISELIGIQTPEELQDLRVRYAQKYDDAHLAADVVRVVDDDHPELAGLLRGVFESPRSGIYFSSQDQLQQAVDDLANAGLTHGGNYPSLFLNADPATLRQVVEQFELAYGLWFHEQVEHKTPKDWQRLFIAVSYAGWRPAWFYAYLARKSMKGLGTDEKELIRAIVPHAETFLQDIIGAYKFLFSRSLIEDVQSETSGLLKDGLVAILKGNGQA